MLYSELLFISLPGDFPQYWLSIGVTRLRPIIFRFFGAQVDPSFSHAGGTPTNKLLNQIELFTGRRWRSLCMLRRRWMGGWCVNRNCGWEHRGSRRSRGELIPESLLCVLSRFWGFDEMERNGSIGNGKESCSSVALGLFKSRVRCSIKRS